mmetsp:Transcript_28690/g.78823  ORF Transcript_28690/g.78823 Transcript_28690/m.78823 type:complete len:519 (-) Transcript_28690:1407-2963(-)|eukprot:CAMPEP_0168760286 /NCGR_PEP_ID=MMETSP0724-20121128/22677_1 /TAXON_ID=265536 /ORGANISM="Amphiprora sp., Strain CCMP467" /LENGTH=518 /DNA_ID=CAMNT_0008809269 /DNA_START=8 /DNA_END=1564 /DNA_ORIENTATION=+
MDEFSAQFGRLSTSAAEWKPQGVAPQDTGASDLKASKVKEFVPGQGWASGVGKEQVESALNPYSQQTEQEEEHVAESSTFASGPLPSPLPSFRAIHSLGLSDESWSHFRGLTLESMRQMDPTDERHKEVLPPYCNAYCLDSEQKASRRSSFGYPCRTFQVTSREDGNLYCLHRFDDVRSVSPKIAAAVLERWTQNASLQEHPGIVPLYRCFVAQRAVFFVHQYIPGARTLQECLSGPLSEVVLWSCVTHLVAAIRKVHSAHLAVRSINLSHILSTTDAAASRLRVRLNCVGILDALEFETRRHVADLQVADIRDLGWLILSLATGTEVTAKSDRTTFAQCENFLAQNFSIEMRNICMTLIKSSSAPSIVDLSRAISGRIYDELDTAYRSIDLTERLLSSEYESGRALRLLLKLGYVNERPEFGQDRRWASSGDCYVLTLFRDFVFHQADGAGYPVMDLGHVVAALNKLDAEDEEKIVLTSRDGKSMMVVSYADVARCLENAFRELCANSVPASALQFS